MALIPIYVSRTLGSVAARRHIAATRALPCELERDVRESSLRCAHPSRSGCFAYGIQRAPNLFMALKHLAQTGNLTAL